MTYDKDNVFAKILRGEAPAYVVEDDEHTFTMMDIMPQSKGHTLVIPKISAANLLDVAKETLTPLIHQVQRVSLAVDKVFRPDGVMVVQLNRAGAGQSVFHLHFHVIPKWGGLNLTMHSRTIVEGQVLEQQASAIRQALDEIPK